MKLNLDYFIVKLKTKDQLESQMSGDESQACTEPEFTIHHYFYFSKPNQDCKSPKDDPRITQDDPRMNHFV